MEKKFKQGSDNTGFQGDREAGQTGYKVTQVPTNGEKVDDEEEDVDISCGIGRFRTKIFGKWFANLYVFIILLSISAVCHRMSEKVIDIHISSLQKQFNIDAAQTALLDTAHKAGLLTTMLIPGHFAKRAHIPLMIGSAGVIQGLFLTTPAILQFIKPYNLPVIDEGSNKTSPNEKYLCMASSMNLTLEPEVPVEKLAYYSIMIAQFLKGAIDPFHSMMLVNVYMDDNTLDKSRMAFLIGIQHIIMDLAKPLGKSVNGFMTEIPIDLKPTTIKPKDPRFVGAWWLGFLAFGMLSALFSAPILLFPKRLVSKKKQEEALANAVVSFSGVDNTKKKKDKQKLGAVTGPPAVGQDRRRSRVDQLMHDARCERRRSSFMLTPDFKEEDGEVLGDVIGIQDNSLGGPEGNQNRRFSYGVSYINEDDNKITEEEDDDEKEEERIPGQRRRRRNNTTMGETDFKTLLRDFPRAVLRLFKSPVFIMIILDIVIISVPMSGTEVFRAMYVAKEFNVPMKDVSNAKAVTMVICSVLGTILSMWISSKIKTKYGYMWIMFFTYLATTLVVPFYLFLGCDDYPVYGAKGSIGISVNQTANDCECDMHNQLLSCGADGNIYYSPCHAGCHNVKGQKFLNCDMLQGNSTAKTLTPGLCETPCYINFLIYIIGHGVQNLVETMAMVPRKLLLIRSVDPKDRGFATGLFQFFRILLAVPAPNLFSRVIDSACLVTKGKVCNLYDRTKIRYIMSGIDVGVHVIIQINMGGLIIMSRIKDRILRKKREKKEAVAMKNVVSSERGQEKQRR